MKLDSCAVALAGVLQSSSDKLRLRGAGGVCSNPLGESTGTAVLDVLGAGTKTGASARNQDFGGGVASSRETGVPVGPDL